MNFLGRQRVDSRKEHNNETGCQCVVLLYVELYLQRAGRGWTGIYSYVCKGASENERERERETASEREIERKTERDKGC